MAEYFKIKLQEKEIQEQRKLAKSRNFKNCSKCEKKFTIFKRKAYCSVCGHSFCTDCMLEQRDPNSASTSASNSRYENKHEI
jgi:rRNA maturation endonuclease Nob1